MFDRHINQSLRRLLKVGVLLILSLFAIDVKALIAVDNVSTVVDNNPTTLPYRMSRVPGVIV